MAKSFQTHNPPKNGFRLDNTQLLELRQRFEGHMKHWGEGYCDWAGCEVVYVDDDDVVGGKVHPEGGDWVVVDQRGNSGTYGYDHGDFSICKVKLRDPKRVGVDYSLKEKKLAVDAKELMYRYQWFCNVFSDWAHRTQPDPLTVWDDIEAIQAAYKKERDTLKDDPHLALYWLLHFGLTVAERYSEVWEIVEDYRLYEALPSIDMVIGFFATTDPYYDLIIQPPRYSDDSDAPKFEQLFLKRRAYLLFLTHSYKKRGGSDSFDKWWLSVAIAPEPEPLLIRRIRWLRNNLNDFDCWPTFSQLPDDKVDVVGLSAYLRACNPLEERRSFHADKLVQALGEDRQLWKTEKLFAEVLLWNVRDIVSDKSAFEEVCAFYFSGNTACQEYQDILATLGKQIAGAEDIQGLLTQLDDIAKDYNGLGKEKDLQPIQQKIDELFSGLEIEQLFLLAENIKKSALIERAFRYIYFLEPDDSQRDNRNDVLRKLFVAITPSDHDIVRIFKGELKALIRTNDDPNIELVHSFLFLPESLYRYDDAAKSAREAACMFFLHSAHLPRVFETIMALISTPENYAVPKLCNAVFTQLLSEEYESKVNPTQRFSEAQIETMLDTVLAFIQANKQHEERLSEAIRVIYYCEHPDAEKWIKKQQKNPSLNQLHAFKVYGDSLKEELDEAFRSALEYIEDAKYSAFMTHDSEEGRKHWKLTMYGDGYVVASTTADGRSQSREYDFDSVKKARAAAVKAVKTKLKAGFKHAQEHGIDYIPDQD